MVGKSVHCATEKSIRQCWKSRNVWITKKERKRKHSGINIVNTVTLVVGGDDRDRYTSRTVKVRVIRIPKMVIVHAV